MDSPAEIHTTINSTNMAKVQSLTKADAKRRVLGLSFEQVANRANRPVSTVRYYLKNEAIKSVEIADDIAKALNDDIAIFLPEKL